MTDRFDNFLDIVAWIVVVLMGLRTAALLIGAWYYADSHQRLLDTLHRRKRTFPWPSSLLWVLVALAWLFA
jgi:hypothetical protein